MPVSGLNIAVRRPFGSDATQAPIIPSSRVETVLRNPPIKRSLKRSYFDFIPKKTAFPLK